MKSKDDKTIKKESLITRPPIVVVMGHIDHGKTTLLDFIRKTKVAEKESGGITQHIGAYEIKLETKNKELKTITFIDTPGHEAFSKMRQRGAKIADLAILVVAANEGVKAQTMEAITAIKEAKIPFIVAANKIDQESANPERIKNELAKNEVYIEGTGGNIPYLNISAKTGQGVPELLEMILLVAEMEELKADPNCPASGIVIESHLDPKRGNTATLIIQNGILKKKMFVRAGEAIAPVKILENFLGQPIEEATFSSPVRIIGFDKLPEVGAAFKVFETKNEAERINLKDIGYPSEGYPISFRWTDNAKTIIPLIIKTDVSGSSEALQKEIAKLATSDIAINILRLGVGNISEDDVKLAASGENPIIIGFRVKCDLSILDLAERQGVAIKLFDIIYKINEWLEEEIRKRAPQKIEEEFLGKAELIKIFRVEKTRQIVGGKVLEGKIVNGKYVKIIRRGTTLTKGRILELQHNRIKVPEVEQGKEFGVLLEIKAELAPKDIIEIYDIKTVRQS